MKIVAICILCFASLFAGSCSKESRHSTTTLQVQVNDGREDVEWADVVSTRPAGAGNFRIEAQGANGEQFYLDLPQLTGTGTINGLTVRQLFYADANGFKPTTIEAGFVELSRYDQEQICGHFQAFFPNRNRSVKLTGLFRISGQD